jgi:hypothetical protein
MLTPGDEFSESDAWPSWSCDGGRHSPLLAPHLDPAAVVYIQMLLWVYLRHRRF